MKLYCFPHAGGAPETYQQWLNPLTPIVELIPMAHKSRRMELFDLINEITTVIKNQLSGEPYAFFGHSFGSLVAFEVAVSLQNQGVMSPSVLILSGKRPLIYSSKKQRHMLNNEDFFEEILCMGGLSKESNEERFLLKMFLQKVKADFKMSETYKYSQNNVVVADIIVLNGLDDAETNNNEMEDWGLLNIGDCEVHHFTGGHFFIFNHQTEILKVIRHKLASHL